MSGVPQRALVTGGSSGIGRAIAVSLATAGCDVGIFHIGSPDDAQPVLDEIQATGRTAWASVTDISDSSQVNDALEAFLTQFDGVDILINNAGIFRDQVIWKMTDDQWHDVINVDLTGAFNCSRAVAPVMRKAKWGAIVNISSINGLRGKFGQTNYCAAKAGLIGLTKAMAKELARDNITVNAVAPGLIDTPATSSLPDEAREQALSEILLGRVGSPQDIADTVTFLCSNKARFITGQTIRVDGGQYI